MNRINFIKQCGLACAGLTLLPALQQCAGTKYISLPMEDHLLKVPFSAFEEVKDGKVRYRKFVVVENDALQFPICVYRISQETYHALWMKCTHQGNELHVYGDRLQCPAHGSEFTPSGAVQNGPASDPLRTFKTTITESTLNITLQ